MLGLSAKQRLKNARSLRGFTSAAAPLSLNFECAPCEESGLPRRPSEAYEYIFPSAGTTNFQPERTGAGE